MHKHSEDSDAVLAKVIDGYEKQIFKLREECREKDALVSEKEAQRYGVRWIGGPSLC